MRNYIILNNKNSNTISGLIIQELAPISKPQQRTQVETIDGRDGDIVTPLGYAAYNKKIKIGLYGNFDINEIIAYFATQGTAIFSNEPDKYYNYQILDQIDYERLVRFRVATVTMHVQPFKYSATEGTLTIDASDTVSGEGSEIALDNTAEAPFNVLRHKGNATQTTYSGKNLAWSGWAEDFVNRVDNSARAKIETFDGKNCVWWRENTGYGDYDNKYIFKTDFQPNTQYTLSCDLFPTREFALMSIKYTDGTGQRLEDITPNQWNHVVVTSIAGKTIKYIQVAYFEGNVYCDIDTFQLELGSTATAYEPYVGGTASPNPDYPQDIHVVTGEQTVNITGKNLFDISKITNVADHLWNNGDGTISITTYAGNTFVACNETFAQICPTLKEGDVATLSATSTGTGKLVYFLGGGGSWSFGASKTITAAMLSSKLCFYASGVSTSAIISNIQIELGSSASEFEPYKDQNYVIPFGDTYLAAIGDYVDEPVKVGDTWYIRRAIGKAVLDGTETGWGYNSNNKVFWGKNSDLLPNGGFTAGTTGYWPKLSDYFTYYAQSGNNAALPDGLYENTYTSGGSQLLFHYSAITSLADFKAWLAANKPTVYYVLAEPTDEEVTNEALADQLDEFYGQAHSYKGRTHLTATPQGDNAPAVLAVEVGEDNESTVTNAGNTTSRPILTIYGQGDIGMYINDVQVLDIALGNEQYITIDSVAMEAYKDTTENLKNRLVTGDYNKLALNAGANKIYFTGNVTKYEISKYSRWL